ncbi:hypothetical protein [Microbacterium sp. No. 7]|uniref:hypothetical protein n=1 Tax=Microbacterium sp. No. 7 TaxID=1714373 RepID=UPI0006ED1669|nr:hypothetical protein [Microbacterium sp. No. 7]ALJ18502.1 hypothetical protein AOA12_00655 [Microbacterium sp. No. 7]
MERSRKQKLLTRAVVALFSAACLAVGVVHVAEGAELPVTVSIADKEFFVSATGKVVHRVGDAGESLELWTRDDGSAMTVHRYQGVPRSDGFVSPDEYSKQQQEVTDEWGVDLSRTEEVQYFSADEVQVDPDALVPRIIIAATASSISVAWNEVTSR